MGVEGLDYWDVWLDKDCVVGPDGTLHFADLEGMEWFVAGQDFTVKERIEKQWGRNFYEFMYGLDALLREHEHWDGKLVSQEERRREAGRRVELALLSDPFVKCEPLREGLDLFVCPRLSKVGEFELRVIDY